jgi:NAD-dependent DNA ligase
MPTSLNLVKGIGPATAERLTAAGLATVEDLAVATPEQLEAVPGFGEFKAKQVITHARQLVAESAAVADESKVGRPSAEKKGVVKSKKRKSSKKGDSKKKDDKKKGKKVKLKKDKGKADKTKRNKGKKKSGFKKSAKKKKK